MTGLATDVTIVGAGPYGLSIATHLRAAGVKFRIFGQPMQSWGEQMPQGMLLKSDGFASTLFDPKAEYTLQAYCREHGLPYADVGLPVSRELFVAYGLEFQRRLVPMLERTNITSVQRAGDGFELQTACGESFFSARVVVAAGITHFGQMPASLAALPKELVTHSLGHHDLSRFDGRLVAVIGGGSSAVDIAALLHEAGAHVQLIARRPALSFHAPSTEPRPWHRRVMNPRSGLGLGWRSRMCTDAPLVFRMLPPKLRVRVVRKHLGPAPGWFVREKVVGRFPQHMGAELCGAEVVGGQVLLRFRQGDACREISVDHVIAATGFRVDLRRLEFLDEDVRQDVRTFADGPVLSRNFESSVRGLYFVGVASSHEFGPLTRFAYGAKFTARRISRHLKVTASRSRVAADAGLMVRAAL